MEQRNYQILHTPENLHSIQGFFYGTNQIILLYSTSLMEDSWIDIYKSNHQNTNDIVEWCQRHGIDYQILDKKCSKVFRKFIEEYE